MGLKVAFGVLLSVCWLISGLAMAQEQADGLESSMPGAEIGGEVVGDPETAFSAGQALPPQERTTGRPLLVFDTQQVHTRVPAPVVSFTNPLIRREISASLLPPESMVPRILESVQGL